MVGKRPSATGSDKTIHTRVLQIRIEEKKLQKGQVVREGYVTQGVFLEVGEQRGGTSQKRSITLHVKGGKKRSKNGRGRPQRAWERTSDGTRLWERLSSSR